MLEQTVVRAAETAATSGIPVWVTVLGLIVATGLVPVGKMVFDFFKERNLTDIERAKIQGGKDDKFMAFLEKELERSRTGNADCERKYQELSEQFRLLSARCARLEALIAHLHPEIGDDLLAARG